MFHRWNPCRISANLRALPGHNLGAHVCSSHEEYTMSIIDWKKLRTMQPYSRQHIARLESQNRWPKRVRLGNGPRGRCGWVLEEVEAHLKKLMDNRHSVTP